MKLATALKIWMFLLYAGYVFSCTFKPDLEAIESQLLPFEAPVISAVSPAQLFTGGSTEVEITGENFESGTSVKIAGDDCLIEKIIGKEKILCLAPASAEGSFSVVVTGPDGRTATTGISYDKLAYTKLSLLSGKLIAPTGNIDGYFSNGDSIGASQIIYEPGYLYLAEYDGHKIKKVDLGTLYSSTMVGTGTNSSPDLTETNPLLLGLSNPSCIAKDNNDIYFCISDEGIAKLNTLTGVITLVAGVSVDNVTLGDSFRSIRRIYLLNGHLIVVDYDTIKDVNLSNSVVTTIAGVESAGTAADGLGTAATFEEIDDSALIGEKLYIADGDYYNSIIREVNLASGANYAVTTVAGDYSALPGYGVESADGTGAAATFNNIAGLTVYGNKLFIADEFSYDSILKLRIFDPATAAVSTSFTVQTANQSVLGKLDDKARIRGNRIRGILYIENYGLIIGNEYGLQRIQ